MTKYTILILIFISLTGCANFGKKMKALVSGKDAKKGPVKIKSVNFSDKDFHRSGPRRQYTRVTKKSLEQANQLNSRAGSLWVMEGQGSYLFSQNVVRMIGDSMSVRLEGDPRDQLEAKVQVIQNLLDKIKERKKQKARRLASKRNKVKGKQKAEEPSAKKVDTKKVASKEGALSVKTVPTRIVERMLDGNYRIKGSQPFMLDKYEYKVIVMGVVRSEDFNEEGVSASKLLDPKFEIVSSRRSVSRL